MSVATNMSERQLRIGLVKLALVLVGFVGLLAVGATLLIGQGQSIAVAFLLISVALSLLANGFLAVLNIIDWFEARKRNG